MKLFRKTLFWLHLIAGLISGLLIAIMCFTGTVLAFEHEIVEWAERDARQVRSPGSGTPPLPLDELQRRVREARPELRTAGVTLRNDPTAAIAFSAGRDGGFYANPYTGELRQPASTRVHDFMHVMVDWHRYLALGGEHRSIGKLINGICNLAFFGLAVTGLYLWWPRTWSWRGFKAIASFNWKLSGKARDFNWHNSIGLWTAPILIVLTLTAVPISFRWGGDLINRLAGEEAAVPGGPGGPASTTPAIEIVRPSPDATPISHGLILARVQQEFPRWQQISLRTGGSARGGRGGGGPPGSRGGPAGSGNPAVASAAPGATGETMRGRAPGESSRGEGRPATDARAAAPQPLSVTIREAGSWPRTATTTLTLNPFTGETLARAGYADLSTARKIRSWTRFLHTGQALGWPGQLAAGLASLGGCFLVYTGFALSWRRFFRRKFRPKPIPAATRLESTPAGVP